MPDEEKELSEEGKTAKIARGAMQIAGGVVPFAGGLRRRSLVRKRTRTC